MELIYKVCAHAKLGEWTVAKVVWLVGTGQFKPTYEEEQPLWNVYGSEEERVLDHLQELTKCSQSMTNYVWDYIR